MKKHVKFNTDTPYSPHFSPKQWKKLYKTKAESCCDDCNNIFYGGLRIGILTAKQDLDFDQLKNRIGNINIEMLINYAITHGVSVSNKNLNQAEKEGLDAKFKLGDLYFETFYKAVELIINETSEDKPLVHIEEELNIIDEMVVVIMRRVFLIELWERIKYFNWKLENITNGLNVKINKSNKDYGRAISVAKYENDILQMNMLNLEMHKVKSLDFLRTLNCHNQVPFFYEKIQFENFKNNPNLNISLAVNFWSFLVLKSHQIMDDIRKEIKSKNSFNISFHITINQKEFIEEVSNYLSISNESSSSLIDLFCFSGNNIKDIWRTPIYKSKSNYKLLITPILLAQFQRVIDYIATHNIKNSSHVKGIAFEKMIEKNINNFISENILFKTRFCKVVASGYKRTNNSPQFDIIIRIGETYLLIELKSSIFRTSTKGYNEMLKNINRSDIDKKENFFIDNYKSFKKKHDPTANFDLNTDKIFSLFLTSVPHAVGTKINNTPVVDLSTLGRYFADGNFKILDVNGNYINFNFYNNFDQAESNLQKYFNNPPQLLKYTDNYITEPTEHKISDNGFRLLVDNSYINLTQKTLKLATNKLLTIKDNWYI